ncbi:MAG: hypothetical protein E6G27_05810 [Actinobacteria bacterium]|nr:MAG: hypothetical protein E6G27_05810 [Actinomycetota bacterium]
MPTGVALTTSSAKAASPAKPVRPTGPASSAASWPRAGVRLTTTTRAALTAALSPTPGPWLYYVVVEASGKHAFATTLDEQNRNIALAHQRGLR